MSARSKSALVAIVLATLAAASGSAQEVPGNRTVETNRVPPLSQTLWSRFRREVLLEQSATPDPEHVLPPIIWGENNEWNLHFGGDIQYRREFRKNFDLNREVDDDDHLSFLRTRVHGDLVYRSFARAFVEVLDAHAYHFRTDPMQSDEWDLFQGFVELKDQAESPWTLRVGRQQLPSIGEGRVFGTPPSVDLYWFNLLKNFDGAMLDYRSKEATVHTFLLQPVSYQKLHDGHAVTGHARRSEGEWFYGMYGNFHYLDPHEFDVYFLGLSDTDEERTFPKPVVSEAGRFGSSDRYTVGTRWRGPILKREGSGTLGYGFEGAYQFGHACEDAIQASMLHADVNYLWDHPWKPKVTLLGNLASGDRKPGDREKNTFSPLYGSSHYAYGTMDLVRLQNLRELGLTASVEPTKKLKVQTGLHRFWLDSPTDAWVTAAGTSLGRDPKGKSGRELGTEVDITAFYKYSKALSFEAGAAHFFSGRFAEKIGRPDDGNYFFLQTVYKF